MKAGVIFFGQLVDITKANNIEVDDIFDTESLLQKLYAQFPDLKFANFSIAVNNNIVEGNVILQADSTIALMPPFSGG